MEKSAEVVLINMENYTIFAIDIQNQTLSKSKRSPDCGKNVAVTMDITCKMENAKLKFDEIYSQNLKKVVFFANSYLNDIDEAKNVSHDVFAALWKNFDSIEQEKVVAYIFITAKHMCLNILKRRTVVQKYNSYKQKTDYLNFVAIEWGGGNDNSIDIYEKEVQEIMSKGMNLMTKKVRRTFLLSRIKGLKNREIAVIEDVAESTIEARMTSALLVMRNLLQDYIKI